MKSALISILLLVGLFFSQPGQTQSATAQVGTMPNGEPILCIDHYVVSSIAQYVQAELPLVIYYAGVLRQLQQAKNETEVEKVKVATQDSLAYYLSQCAKCCQTIDLWVYYQNPQFLGKKVHFKLCYNKQEQETWSWQMPEKIGGRFMIKDLSPLQRDP